MPNILIDYIDSLAQAAFYAHRSAMNVCSLEDDSRTYECLSDGIKEAWRTSVRASTSRIEDFMWEIK
jgi:hypothetical protein